MKPIYFFCIAFLSSNGWAYDPAGTPDDWESPMPGMGHYGKLLSDRLETGFADELDTYVWDVQGWYGGDRNRLWIKTEGEGEQGNAPEDAEVQLLFSRMFAPFWDWQVGARHDFKPEPDRSQLVFGIQGVVPYEFEVDTALFVSEEGDVTARFEAEYDLKITQRLILQPRFELNASFSDVSEIGVGTGINNTELGLRLRYEVRREFAPYIGIAWQQRYGNTADYARAEGEQNSVTSLLLGVRAWF